MHSKQGENQDKVQKCRTCEYTYLLHNTFWVLSVECGRFQSVETSVFWIIRALNTQKNSFWERGEILCNEPENGGC